MSTHVENGGALFYDTKESLEKEKTALLNKIATLQAKIVTIDAKLSTYVAKVQDKVAAATEKAQKPFFKRIFGLGGRSSRKVTRKRTRSNKK